MGKKRSNAHTLCAYGTGKVKKYGLQEMNHLTGKPVCDCDGENEIQLDGSTILELLFAFPSQLS